MSICLFIFVINCTNDFSYCPWYLFIDILYVGVFAINKGLIYICLERIIHIFRIFPSKLLNEPLQRWRIDQKHWTRYVIWKIHNTRLKGKTCTKERYCIISSIIIIVVKCISYPFNLGDRILAYWNGNDALSIKILIAHKLGTCYQRRLQMQP